MTGWIDAHAHLAGLENAALANVLDRAQHAGISHIVNTATNLSSSEIVRVQARTNPILKATAGVSPPDTRDLPVDWDIQLEALLASGDFCAVGEIGLDTANPSYPSLDIQEPAFFRQLELANKYDLPIVLHSRGCEAEVLGMIQDAGIRRAFFHCYTGSADTVSHIVNAGYVISFPGIATFKSRPLDAQIEACPIDRMLIETDCPYLAPVPYRGQTNEPAFVVETGKVIAGLKGVSEEELKRVIMGTFGMMFGL